CCFRSCGVLTVVSSTHGCTQGVPLRCGFGDRLTRTATAERPQSPAPKNHSATLHNLVQLCLQQQPER
ncbi:hypothetical protein M9458_013019, partial [Cirrhinus mrigala]